MRARLVRQALAALLASSLAALPGVVRAEVPVAQPAAAQQLQAVASALDSQLREAGSGVHARAQTLAELPRLQAAVSTDAATVADLTQDELAFRPRPAEWIEIGQVEKAGKVTSLWRSDPAAPPGPPLDKSGFHVALDGKTLRLAEVVEVRPRDREDELRGALSLSWPVELASVAQAAARLGVPVLVSIGDRQLELAGTWPTAPDPNTTLEKLDLKSPQGKGVSVAAYLPLLAPATPATSGAPGVSGTLIAGGAVALIALIGGVLFLRRPRPAAAGPVAAAVASPADPVAGLRSTGSVAGEVSATGATALASAVNLTPPPSGSAISRAAAGESPGSTHVGRYTIVRRLGSGGMADVFLARLDGEAGFEKQVALKVLHPQMAQVPMIVQHFLDEAKLASRLVHPNIVQISDLGRAGEAFFIAMEYVEGSDLERLLTLARDRQEPVPLRVAFTIAQRMLDGLQAAHVALTPDGRPLELVHRDVKSANVFVARNGAVKIGDFGIAKATQDARVARTEVGQVKGTAAYMSPEHRIGQAVDARADQYSAGAIAYEIFTGQEINLDLVRIAHLGKEGWPHLAAPSTVRTDLPPGFDAVLFKALAYERDDRYPSCEAFADALESLANAASIVPNDKAVAAWVADLLRNTDQATPEAPTPSDSSGYASARKSLK